MQPFYKKVASIEMNRNLTSGELISLIKISSKKITTMLYKKAGCSELNCVELEVDKNIKVFARVINSDIEFFTRLHKKITNFILENKKLCNHLKENSISNDCFTVHFFQAIVISLTGKGELDHGFINIAGFRDRRKVIDKVVDVLQSYSILLGKSFIYEYIIKGLIYIDDNNILVAEVKTYKIKTKYSKLIF